MEVFKIVVLSLSGLLLFFVGMMRVSNPVKTYAKNSGINLTKDTDLLNEMRGASGVMFLGGITIILGIFIPILTSSSFVVATLLFLGFASGRIIGIATDGKPNKQLVTGLVSELVLGTACAICTAQILV